jgi:predicted kinase
MSRRVYTALVERAALIVARGHSAIVDAVFLQPSDRQALEEAAAAAGVPFLGVWLDAPEDVLVARIEARRRDPSDADAAVVRAQLAQGPGPIEWHRLQAGAGPQAIAAAAVELLGGASGPG